MGDSIVGITEKDEDSKQIIVHGWFPTEWKPLGALKKSTYARVSSSPC